MEGKKTLESDSMNQQHFFCSIRVHDDEQQQQQQLYEQHTAAAAAAAAALSAHKYVPGTVWYINQVLQLLGRETTHHGAEQNEKVCKKKTMALVKKDSRI